MRLACQSFQSYSLPRTVITIWWERFGYLSHTHSIPTSISISHTPYLPPYLSLKLPTYLSLILLPTYLSHTLTLLYTQSLSLSITLFTAYTTMSISFVFYLCHCLTNHLSVHSSIFFLFGRLRWCFQWCVESFSLSLSLSLSWCLQWYQLNFKTKQAQKDSKLWSSTRLKDNQHVPGRYNETAQLEPLE